MTQDPTPEEQAEEWKKSTTCVVVINFKTEEMCGEPVVGERAGWPMCSAHMELFKKDA